MSNNNKKHYPPIDTGPGQKPHDSIDEPQHEHNIHNKVQNRNKVSST